jgi:hypothetical protein
MTLVVALVGEILNSDFLADS